jgi:hypothetical protein
MGLYHEKKNVQTMTHDQGSAVELYFICQRYAQYYLRFCDRPSLNNFYYIREILVRVSTETLAIPPTAFLSISRKMPEHRLSTP